MNGNPAQEKTNPVFDDLLRFESFSGGEYRGEEDRLLYSVSRLEKGREGRRLSAVFLLDCVSGAAVRITAGGSREQCARFSPDGSRVLFLSNASGCGMQIFTAELGALRPCGESWPDELRAGAPLTRMRFGAMDPLWSPDGSEILFASPGDASQSEDWHFANGPDSPTVPERRPQQPEPVVIEDFGYKSDGAGFVRSDSHIHLWVVPSSGGRARRITDGPYDYLHHTWSPDGKSAACISGRFHPKAEPIGSDLILLDAAGKAPPRRLTEKEWAVSYPNPVRPVFTPDGKFILMPFLRADQPSDAGYPPALLHRVAADGSDDTILTSVGEGCCDCVQFPYNAASGHGMERLQVSEDGSYAYFLAGCEGETRLFRIDLESRKVETVFSGEQAVGGFGRPSGGKLLLGFSMPDKPEGYYLLDEPGGGLRPLLQSNRELLAERCFSRPQNFRYRTLDRESRVQGWVLPPQSLCPGEKAPCILYIHGGPHPFYTHGFSLEHQCFAGAGFGVLTCNPRGSSGYGDVHRNLQRAYDGSAFTDCLQFVEEACRRYPWIDPDRIGVTGGSYGGYLTNYIATHSVRFKAFVSQRSVVNELIDYASSDMQGSSLSYPNFEEFMVAELKRSPIAYAERVNAPFLILHGMEDLRTPVEGAHQLFVALKDLHPSLPVKMVLYPHVGHEQPEHLLQLLHYYREMLDWFRRYL